MLKRLLGAVLMAGLLLPAPSFATTHYPKSTTSTTSTPATNGLQEFASESAAKAHCPSDTVVWLNTNSGIWHEKGMRWYGATREGAYVCRKEAAVAGDRDTRNGQ